MAIKSLLKNVALFEGLSDKELDEIAAICQERQLEMGEKLTKEGEIGEEFFLIKDGVIEVLVSEKELPMINLGTGQVIGEMSLVDKGRRSATARAKHGPTNIYAIRHDDFHALCEQDTRIGYVVMHNIATDLSIKLRHHNLMLG